MAKRGRPPKAKVDSPSAVEAEAKTVETKETKASKSDVGSGHVNPPGLNDERESAYSKFEAMRAKEEAGDIEGMSEYGIETMEDAVSEEAPITEDAPETPEDIAAKKDEVISEPITQDDLDENDENKKAETSSEKEEAGQPEPEEIKDKEQKTVPLDALHEEREKRKFLRKQNEELEAKNAEISEQLHQVLQDLKKKSESEGSDEFMTEEDEKVNALKSDIEELKMERQKRIEKENSDAVQSAQTELQNSIKRTAEELKDEGFPGFEFLADRVGAEILNLIAEDPDNAYLQNPDGWKKVYKERVFPPVKQLFAEKEKSEILDAKKEAKKGASLVTSPGAPDKKPEKDESQDWTYADYIASRKERSL